MMNSDRKHTLNKRGKWSMMFDNKDSKSLFQPLVDYLEHNVSEDKEDVYGTLNQYMWMMEDEEKTYYKHFGDRSYFKIGHDGKTEGTLQDWKNWI